MADFKRGHTNAISANTIHCDEIFHLSDRALSITAVTDVTAVI